MPIGRLGVLLTRTLGLGTGIIGCSKIIDEDSFLKKEKLRANIWIRITPRSSDLRFVSLLILNTASLDKVSESIWLRLSGGFGRYALRLERVSKVR